MSIECTRWVWQHSRSRNSDRLVLLCIADFANPDGTGAYPSVGTIAAWTGLDERTVRYSLRYLELDLKELAVVKGEGRHGTNRYQVLMSEGGKVFPPQSDSRGEKSSGEKISGGENNSPNPPVEENLVTDHVSLSGGVEGGWGEKFSPPAKSSPEKISPLTVPNALAAFERVLRQSNRKGFSPTQQFYDKVMSKYGHLDLEEEAIKMTGWLTSKPSRPLSTAYILNWLKKAGEDAVKGSGSNGYSRNPNRPVISTDSDRAFLERVSQNRAR